MSEDIYQMFLARNEMELRISLGNEGLFKTKGPVS